MPDRVPFDNWRPHPWHGLAPGKEPPYLLDAYIEMTPFDAVKYEIDKATGYLRVDRPQITSSLTPTLYGFVPRTFCGPRVAALSESANEGDGDPIDICVLSERPIDRAEILLPTRILGGLRLIDRGEADDKIIAVLDNDTIWSTSRDLADVPDELIERLRHYFTTYKLMPGKPSDVSIEDVYGAEKAAQVVQASLEDYRTTYGSEVEE